MRLERAARALTPTWKRRERHRQQGSLGERILQERFGTAQRARQFYQNQVTDQLTPGMREFIGRMEMAFIATSDGQGECDCTLRAGPAGFIRVLGDRTIAYPEYRGNGVMASLGNMLTNPHVGILLIDFTHDLIGLHLNGDALTVTHGRMRELDLGVPAAELSNPGRRPVQWVLVNVTEAYIHCSKHIPRLVPQSRIRHWGTGGPRYKGGDYFGVAAARTRAERPIAAVTGAASEQAPAISLTGA